VSVDTFKQLRKLETMKIAFIDQGQMVKLREVLAVTHPNVVLDILF
jgi:hypothetical protein